ncbi:hypothetical protein GQ53DRAFT_836930 [Thozetella sp. PMI_491]|nr:hypothetical protein GQ53DRAFT_836930 [Thozetella sp. PMI_491]
MLEVVLQSSTNPNLVQSLPICVFDELEDPETKGDWDIILSKPPEVSLENAPPKERGEDQYGAPQLLTLGPSSRSSKTSYSQTDSSKYVVLLPHSSSLGLSLDHDPSTQGIHPINQTPRQDMQQQPGQLSQPLMQLQPGQQLPQPFVQQQPGTLQQPYTVYYTAVPQQLGIPSYASLPSQQVGAQIDIGQTPVYTSQQQFFQQQQQQQLQQQSPITIQTAGIQQGAAPQTPQSATPGEEKKDWFEQMIKSDTFKKTSFAIGGALVADSLGGNTVTGAALGSAIFDGGKKNKLQKPHQRISESRDSPQTWPHPRFSSQWWTRTEETGGLLAETPPKHESLDTLDERWHSGPELSLLDAVPNGNDTSSQSDGDIPSESSDAQSSEQSWVSTQKEQLIGRAMEWFRTRLDGHYGTEDQDTELDIVEEYGRFLRRELPPLVRRHLESMMEGEIEEQIRQRVVEVVRDLQTQLHTSFRELRTTTAVRAEVDQELEPPNPQGVTMDMAFCPDLMGSETVDLTSIDNFIFDGTFDFGDDGFGGI